MVRTYSTGAICYAPPSGRLPSWEMGIARVGAAYSGIDSGLLVCYTCIFQYSIFGD